MEFPINKDDRFTIWNTETNKAEKKRSPWNAPLDGPWPGLAAHLKPLKEVREQPPAHDTTTHFASPVEVEDLDAETYTYTFEILPLSPEQAEQAAQAANEVTRAEKRDALRVYWDSRPAYIRGPYRALFIAANELLDEKDDDAAGELIAQAEPTPTIAAEVEADGSPTPGGKLDIFNEIKDFIQDGVAAL